MLPGNNSRTRRLRRSFGLAAIALGPFALATLSYLAVSAAIRTVPASVAAPELPPSAQAVATQQARIAQEVAVNRAKPRFTGAIGDFEVVASRDAAHAAQPCQAVPGGTRNASRLIPSELNAPGTWEDDVCADGSVVAAHGPLGGRSYFKGTPRVAADSPAGLLDTTDIDGHLALIVAPPADPGPYFGYAILRPDSSSAPGILLEVIGHGSRQAAIDALRAGLSQ
jgi:hypothetical protein